MRGLHAMLLVWLGCGDDGPSRDGQTFTSEPLIEERDGWRVILAAGDELTEGDDVTVLQGVATLGPVDTAFYFAFQGSFAGPEPYWATVDDALRTTWSAGFDGAFPAHPVWMATPHDWWSIVDGERLANRHDATDEFPFALPNESEARGSVAPCSSPGGSPANSLELAVNADGDAVGYGVAANGMLNFLAKPYACVLRAGDTAPTTHVVNLSTTVAPNPTEDTAPQTFAIEAAFPRGGQPMQVAVERFPARGDARTLRAVAFDLVDQPVGADPTVNDGLSFPDGRQLVVAAMTDVMPSAPGELDSQVVAANFVRVDSRHAGDLLHVGIYDAFTNTLGLVTYNATSKQFENLEVIEMPPPSATFLPRDVVITEDRTWAGVIEGDAGAPPRFVEVRGGAATELPPLTFTEPTGQVGPLQIAGTRWFVVLDGDEVIEERRGWRVTFATRD